MQRAIITKNNVEINRNDAADISAWVSEGEAANWWGLPQREVSIGLTDDVTPYTSTRIESQYLVYNGDGSTTTTTVASAPPEGTAPSDIIYEKKFGTLAAEYTVAVSDVTVEYNQKALLDYSNAQYAAADAQVNTLLQGYDRTTILADNLAQLVIYMNIDGSQTVDSVAAAKTAVLTGLSVYNQLKAIQATMYANIAAQKASLGL